MARKLILLLAAATIIFATTGFDTQPPVSPPPPFSLEATSAVDENEYGYVLAVETYSFDDIALPGGGGTSLGFTYSDDNGVKTIPLGFTTKFYDQTALNTLFISENGFVSFTEFVKSQSNGENKPLPTDSKPNNLIAAFWTDLNIGSGQVYWKKPDPTHTIIQWNNLQVPGGFSVTFQMTIDNTGKIVISYQPYGGDTTGISAGIEDQDGLDGLTFAIGDISSTGRTVSITPPAPGTHVKARPRVQSDFINNTISKFIVVVQNTNNYALPVDDSYSLSWAIESSYPTGYPWEVAFFDAACLTPLATLGPVGQNSSMAFCVQVTATGTVAIGNNVRIRVNITSLADSGIATRVYLQAAISSAWSQLYRDGGNSLKIDMVTPKLSQTTTISFSTTGDHTAYTMLSPNIYMAAWRNGTNIEYRFYRQAQGIMSVPLSIDGGAQSSQEDLSPAMASTTDGHIGLLYSYGLNQSLKLSILNAEGVPQVGTPITLAGFSPSPDVEYFHPTIIPFGSNYFFLAWQTSTSDDDWIECAVVKTSGDLVFYNLIDSDYPRRYIDPKAIMLRDGNVMIAFVDYHDIEFKLSYKVISFNKTTEEWGEVVAITNIDGTKGRHVDLVQLPNGNIVMTWDDLIDSQIGYYVLSSDYSELIPATILTYYDYLTPAPHQTYRRMKYPSITEDATGSAVITWEDGDWQEQLYYALIGSNGSILTQPMLYNRVASTAPKSQISTNGYGNAPLFVLQLYGPLIRKN